MASAVLNAARQAAGAMGVALFGALAGDDPEGVVARLKRSTLIAVAALVGASARRRWRPRPSAASPAPATLEAPASRKRGERFCVLNEEPAAWTP